MREINTGFMTSTLLSSPTSAARSLFAGLREELRARRQASVAHRDLQRELAAYRTPSEILDLLTAVDRQDGDGSEQVRTILSDNLSGHRRGQRLNNVM